MLTEVSSIQNSPFRFLDLPFELRRQIIRHAVSIYRRKPKQFDWVSFGQISFEFASEGYDIIISATGLRFLNLTSLNLGLVNKQVRQEVLSVIFQGSTVCLYVQIPQHGYGPFSEHTASLAAIIQILNNYPLLCDMTRRLTVFVNPERPYIQAVGEKVVQITPRFVYDHFGLMLVVSAVLSPFVFLGYSASRVCRRAATFYSKRDSDLPALVDTILHGFKTCKHLKAILYLDNLDLQDVEIILGLFNMPNCSITLEEWWEIPRRGPMREAALAIYDERYKNFIPAAAEESGHKWFMSVCPSLERIYFQRVEDIMTRQRVWSR